MAQNVTIAGASYPDVPSIVVPKTGGGNASFVDISDTTVTASDVLNGKYFYTSAGVKTNGSIVSQAAQTIMPSTVDQTIASGKYLSGAQTILGDANLVASNILKNVTIFGVTGTLEIVHYDTYDGSVT